LTKWKQKTATKILESALFIDLDTDKYSKKDWFNVRGCWVRVKVDELSIFHQHIVRKFTNYLNNVYLKKMNSSSLSQANPKTSPLLNFSSLLSGRQLFARENRDSINKSTTDRVAAGTGPTNTAAAYQTVLKEMWDSLSAEDQDAWTVRAAAESGDVAQ
jgi:hypothetical protein